jgi:alpha/beta superfamily hydrolase
VYDLAHAFVLSSGAKDISAVTDRIETVFFPGPAGRLEGLWKAGVAPRRGSAVFAHPHPLGGGTMHNKVVFRVARALVANGFSTLRFNFRGVGLSEGGHDAGRGETDDVRVAFGEAERRGGLPLLAGGFSFGSAAALRAARGDARIAAFLGVGVPVATGSVADMPAPDEAIPALFVTGEHDTYGPPDRLREWIGERASAHTEVVIVPGADHFFSDRLVALEEAVGSFLRNLRVPALA